MANPYDVLGVTIEDGDETIRHRYLEAVRQFPPERCPEQFQRLREAYERIQDEEKRLAFLLFEPSQGESVDELLAEEEQCQSSHRRVSLKTLLSLLNQGR